MAPFSCSGNDVLDNSHIMAPGQYLHYGQVEGPYNEDITEKNATSLQLLDAMPLPQPV